MAGKGSAGRRAARGYAITAPTGLLPGRAPAQIGVAVAGTDAAGASLSMDEETPVMGPAS